MNATRYARSQIITRLLVRGKVPGQSVRRHTSGGSGTTGGGETPGKLTNPTFMGLRANRGSGPSTDGLTNRRSTDGPLLMQYCLPCIYKGHILGSVELEPVLEIGLLLGIVVAINMVRFPHRWPGSTVGPNTHEGGV